MLPLDEQERYERAWTGRRHRLWAFVAVLLGLGWALRQSGDDLVAAGLCLAGMVAAIAWFYRFRCPRCGELFVTLRSAPRQMRAKTLRCQHCDLAVNEIPGGTTP